jgi:tripartite-type tricarboxylate transporter receptor subunit TctC
MKFSHTLLRRSRLRHFAAVLTIASLTFKNSTMLTKFFIAVMACATLSSTPAFAQATVYPTKPIKLVVPFPPGGTTDLLARILAERLSATLGQAVIVDNRAGAAGMVGTEAVARAPADGYTLGMATASTHSVNPAVQRKIPYDAQRDFTAISRIASVPNVIVVHPSVPAQTLAEFIALNRRTPGKLAFASPGAGSLGHMLGEIFNVHAQVEILHVPYKGAGPALNDLLGGQVQVMYDNLPTSLPHIHSGKLRALAIASDSRSAALPNVPTFAEANLPGVNEPAWFGVVAPANLSAAISERLHASIASALAHPETKARFEKLGATIVVETSAQFQTFIAKELAEFRAVAAKSKIAVE